MMHAWKWNRLVGRWPSVGLAMVFASETDRAGRGSAWIVKEGRKRCTLITAGRLMVVAALLMAGWAGWPTALVRAGTTPRTLQSDS